MSAAHVRRGGAGRPKAKKPSRVTVPKKIAKRLPVDQARANKVAGLVFGAFLLAIVLVVLVALDIPAKAERAAGAAIGQAGFTVSGYQIVGLNHMNRALVDEVVTDELRRASDEAQSAKAPQALVDVSAIRHRLLQFGWVKDARVSRRLPDTLVIDIVERTPAALWQNEGQLALPEGEDDAKAALTKFARVDKQSGLLGHGIVRFDLRLRGKMIVRLPRAPGEPIAPAPKQEG